MQPNDMQAGLLRNDKAEKRALAAVYDAEQIPDEHVTLQSQTEGLPAVALVTSSRDSNFRSESIARIGASFCIFSSQSTLKTSSV